MNKKDVLELKKRFTKNGCTFTKLSGCYIDAEKNKLVNIQETFLNLDEEEFYKYLDIAKKTLSGTVNNNLLELHFPLQEETPGGKQQFLMGIRESQLKNPDLLDRFYDLIIENYDYSGNYLILLFHDVYDVMKKTSDNMKLDESEEMYEYFICAICPVTLSKAALGYREDEHRIGSRIRDWIVGAPDTGFIFPAFTDRSTDIHSVMFYTKDTKEPHTELMENFLGCPSKRTATIQKNVFNHMIQTMIDTHEEVDDSMLMDIQSELNVLVEEHTENEQADQLVLNPAIFENVMMETGVPQPIANATIKAYEDEFSEEPPMVESLIDTKTLEANAQKREHKNLINEVQALKTAVKEKDSIIEEKDSVIFEKDLMIAQKELDMEAAASSELTDLTDTDVVLKIKPEKIPQITSQIIDGKNYLVIPVDTKEHITINGIKKDMEEFS